MSPPSSLLLYYHAPFPKKYVRIDSLLLQLEFNTQLSFYSLEVYIKSQKALRPHTIFLTLLMTSFLAICQRFISTQPWLDDNVFRFDHQPAIAAEVQDKIDCLFKGQDPAPLRTFSADLRAAQYARSQPSATQQTALSSAQQLIRNARWSIIEPVLASFNLSSDSSDAEQLAPESLRLVPVASTPGASISVSLLSKHIKTHSPRPIHSRPPPPTRPPTTTAKAKKISEPDKFPPILPPPLPRRNPSQRRTTGVVDLNATPPRATARRDHRRREESARNHIVGDNADVHVCFA
ncbi:hypothetical protein EI94DRAFT_1804081 [Lactarius quietus]|nr:hypothetical protein EI94DRAFT_1804081 [Lactarius quietus]